MSNKNCLFFFFAFVPGLSTSFLTAAADKDRCRDLGEVFCLKIHRFLVLLLLSFLQRETLQRKKLKKTVAACHLCCHLLKWLKFRSSGGLMAEKTYLTSLEKVCKGAQRGGLSLEQNEVSGGRVTEQKYTIRTLKINPPARHYFFLLMRKTRTT